MGSDDINKTGGKIIASADERMAICRKCSHLWKGKICKQCGCVMPLKTKIKKAKCPIGNW